MSTRLVPVPSRALIPERDMGRAPILECVNLGLTIGGLKIVENFDLTIGRTEIAGLMGLSYGAVKLRHQNALLLLREYMGE